MAEEGVCKSSPYDEGTSFVNAFEVGTHIKISALEAENRRILERLDVLEKQIKN